MMERSVLRRLQNKGSGGLLQASRRRFLAVVFRLDGLEIVALEFRLGAQEPRVQELHD